jgi:hypothetical protein
MKTMKALFHRARYMPVLPLGEDGRVVTGCPKHIALTRQAARESMVLLKNNGALPLHAGVKLAVFGLGQFAYEQGGTGAGIVYTKYRRSPLDGLRAKEEEGKVSLFKPLIDFYAADYAVQGKQVDENPQYGPLTKYHGQFTTPEKVNLFGKCTYDVNKSATLSDACVPPGTEITHFGAGVEFFPLTDSSDLRLHLAGDYVLGTAAADYIQQPKQLMLTAGLTWRMDLLGLLRK